MADHFMELLCPAGNMDKLKMAIRYGADAVYCAGKRFGLRAGNSNFSDEELKEPFNLYMNMVKKSTLHAILFLITRTLKVLRTI